MDEDERERIAAEVWEETTLSMQEVGDVVRRSQAWVNRAVAERRRGGDGD